MQTKWKNKIILAVLILFCSGTLHAESLKNIQNFYKNYKDFTVNFTQDTYQSLVNKTVHFTGKVSYKRNMGVRMDVNAPQKQVIILKGQTVVVHLPEEGTTQTQNLPPEMATQNVMGFFSGLDTIGEGYEIKESPEALFLYPKGGSGHITVWTEDSHAIKRILVKDAIGNQSDIRLRGYSFDIGVSSKIFHLKETGDTEKKPRPPVPEMKPSGE